MTLKPCPNPRCQDPSPELHTGGYITCTSSMCDLEGPAADPDGQKWNSLPRLEDIGEWVDCDNEIPPWQGYFYAQLEDGTEVDEWFDDQRRWRTVIPVVRWFRYATPPAAPPVEPEIEVADIVGPFGNEDYECYNRAHKAAMRAAIAPLLREIKQLKEQMK